MAAIFSRPKIAMWNVMAEFNYISYFIVTREVMRMPNTSETTLKNVDNFATKLMTPPNQNHTKYFCLFYGIYSIITINMGMEFGWSHTILSHPNAK